MMDGRYILISGSASRSCPDEKVDIAVQLVGAFTEEVLLRGGGIVVLAGREESTQNAQSTPLVFDWVDLRAVGRYSERTMEGPRRYALVVMSDEAPESRIDDVNLYLLRALEQRNVVERYYIRRELFTGGQYREIMSGLSDAMIAVGGGRGTYSYGVAMSDMGKPVLPLDLQLGSIAEDGDGAVALHREMISEPARFLPSTYLEVINRLGLLSLNRGINEASAVARTAAEILEKELEGIPTAEIPMSFKGRLTNARRFLKDLPIVAAAIKIFDFLRGLLPFM